MKTNDFQTSLVQASYTPLFGRRSVVPFDKALDAIDELLLRDIQIDILGKQLAHFATSENGLRAQNSELTFQVRGMEHRIINHVDTIQEQRARITELEATLAEIDRQRTPGANATVSRIMRIVDRVLPRAA